MRKNALLFASLTVLMAGCNDDGGSDRFRVVANVQQLMLTVVEPSAEVYWDAVGWVWEQDEIEEIQPTTDEEWEEVLNAAYVVAESGNLLLMDGRVLPEPWVSLSHDMIEAGRRAIAAANARDPQAVFDAGADLYYSCTACHSAYALEAVRPNVILPQ